MNKKVRNSGKMPLLPRRLSLNASIKNNLIIKDKEYTPVGSLTPRFMNLYSKYIKSKQKTIYPNIRSILNEYRADKIKKLTEQEAMREEIGEEIKKYKDIHDIIKRKGPINREKYFNNLSKQNKKKLKENKGIILDTFFQYDSKIKPRNNKYINEKDVMKLISPYKIFKVNKNSLEERIKNKYANKTSINFNSKKLLEFIESKIKEKTKIRDGKKIKIRDCWDYCHNKINSFCDSITDDSIRIKINGRKTMERFNSTWNKYKKIQEFKNPETKRHYYEKF